MPGHHQRGALIRSELVTRVASQNPHLYARDVEAVVSAILGRIAEGLAVGDRVELRDFGSFAVRRRDARQGRNPRTGTKIDVAAKAEVRFKPEKGMHARLNGGCTSNMLAAE